MKPGFNEELDIYAVDDRICFSTAKFMHETIKAGHRYKNFADVGVRNKKVEIIEKELSVKFTQLISGDFNFDRLSAENGESNFDVITCFEVIEHLQNPLFLMKQLAEMIHPDGIIFLSTPSRPKIFWPDFHYYEMKEKHLNKWLFSQVGLEITRRDRLKIHMPFWAHFTGIRPFLRFFINYTNIYELRIKK
jgi:SAM-dependent methyltransferase